MKTFLYCLVIATWLLSPVAASAKPGHPDAGDRSSFTLFLDEAPIRLMEPYQATLTQLQQKQRKFRRKLAFLKHVFFFVHRKHLKHYEMYSPLTEVMKDGTYDCVSGTALYALILEGLGIPYQIWEMDYHAYLTVDVEGQPVVFESTDPVHGFIDQPELIEQHRSSYEEAACQYHQNIGHDAPLIHRSVDLTQLAGLQLYNRAINALQHQQSEEARQYVRKALTYYQAERIAGLASHLRRQGLADQDPNNH